MALAAPIITAVAALAGTGLAIAQAAGAFAEDIDSPAFGDETEAKRRQAVLAAQSQTDRRRNVLAGETAAPQVSRQTLLGGSEVTGGP